MADESNDDVTVSVTLVRDVAYRPWWAGIAVRYERILGLLPTHKNTKKGRANAKQVKAGLLILGVIVAGFVGGWWIVPGCLVALSALILPVPADTRRSWIASSRTRRKNLTRSEESSAELVFDGRRLLIRNEDKNLRRVLTNKRKHIIEERSLDGSRIVGVLPTSRKKSESIWLKSSAEASGDEMERGEIDILVRLNDDDLNTILAAIKAT